jgi:hypothetical protein
MAFPEFEGKRVPERPYKDAMNRWLTSGLFRDLVIQKHDINVRYHPVFTLYDDRPGYINARRTFIEEGDPTGCRWAIKYLGDYNHFLALSKADWFQVAFERWQEELNAKLASEALDSVRAIAADENDKGRLAAARFLHSLVAQKPKETVKRGRPSNKNADAETKAAEAVGRQVEEDYDRLFNPKVITGGKN